jgi:hypothetical protein
MQEQEAVCKRLYLSGKPPQSVHQKESWQNKTEKNAGGYSMSDCHFNVGCFFLNESRLSTPLLKMVAGRTATVGG